MEVYKSKYSTIRLSENSKIAEHLWSAETEQMTPAEFKTEQLTLKNIIAEYKIQLMYTDARFVRFTITPELQEWNANNALKTFASIGGRKIAIILTSEFIEQLAIEMAMEEGSAAGGTFATKYFSSEAEAKKWLLS